MNDSEELAEKYHKLFQDYTRIKAQHAVLKKAVLKEQTENATIQATLKEKEQEVRKSLQDLDLLTFHNQRLTKRIENLQNQASTKSGGSWLVGGSYVKKELEKSQSTLEATTIDLQTKIEENEKLHEQLYEINSLYPRHVTELKGKIQELEKQNQELLLDVERAGVANEDTIALIRKEKEATEKELGKIRDVLAGQLQDEQRSNQSLRDNIQRLENEIDRLSKVEFDLESLQREHTKLKGELDTLKWISSELSQLQESYGSLERDKVHIEKAHSQLSQQYAALREADENLKRALAKEQENSRSVNEKTKLLYRDLEAVRGEAAFRERGHVERIGLLESELAKAQKEKERLQNQYEELKVAEQAAKEGESRTKEGLAHDLSSTRSSLANAEKRVKELEDLKITLEGELTEVKKTLEETKANLAAEIEKRQVSIEEHEVEHTLSESETKTEGDDERATEEENSEKLKPLSKKQRKKKKAAAAAAAAAATTAVETATVAAKDGEKASGIPQDTNNEQDTQDSEILAAEAELKGRKQKDEEEARKAAEESLKAEIETLKQQIEESNNSNETKQNELQVIKAALENVKDEKLTLAQTLEMHVDMTIQLQQDLENLQDELAKLKEHGVNKTTTGKHNGNNGDEDLHSKAHNKDDLGAQGLNGGDQTPQRAVTPVPSAGGDVQSEAASIVSKNESTQVDKIESSDKAVQSESVEKVDGSTQSDIPIKTVDSQEKVKDVADVGDSDAASSIAIGEQSIVSKSSRGSLLGDDNIISSLSTMTAAATATTTNQSNREHLIKKYYENKIQNITEQLQLSDGRYARLHKEFELLKELLVETVQAKEAECNELKSKNSILQEDLAAAKEDNRAQVEIMNNFMKSLENGR